MLKPGPLPFNCNCSSTFLHHQLWRSAETPHMFKSVTAAQPRIRHPIRWDCHRWSGSAVEMATNNHATMSIKEEDTTSRMSLGRALEHAPAASESRQMKESHVSTWWWLRKHQKLMTWLVLVSYQAVWQQHSGESNMHKLCNAALLLLL